MNIPPGLSPRSVPPMFDGTLFVCSSSGLTAAARCWRHKSVATGMRSVRLRAGNLRAFRSDLQGWRRMEQGARTTALDPLRVSRWRACTRHPYVEQESSFRFRPPHPARSYSRFGLTAGAGRLRRQGRPCRARQSTAGRQLILRQSRRFRGRMSARSSRWPTAAVG